MRSVVGWAGATPTGRVLYRWFHCGAVDQTKFFQDGFVESVEWNGRSGQTLNGLSAEAHGDEAI